MPLLKRFDINSITPNEQHIVHQTVTKYKLQGQPIYGCQCLFVGSYRTKINLRKVMFNLHKRSLKRKNIESSHFISAFVLFF